LFKIFNTCYVLLRLYSLLVKELGRELKSHIELNFISVLRSIWYAFRISFSSKPSF